MTQLFSDFDLPSVLQKNLQALNLITPTPIQQDVIPLALQGRDVLGTAQTGTGKTLAFALPMALQAHLYTGDTQRPPFSRYGFTFGPILLAAVGAFNASVDAVALPGVDPTAPQDWLIAQGNLTFGVAGVAGVTFVPYGAIYGETFSVYPVFLAAPLPPAVGAVSIN
jgi:hypothetical protein